VNVKTVVLRGVIPYRSFAHLLTLRRISQAVISTIKTLFHALPLVGLQFISCIQIFHIGICAFVSPQIMSTSFVPFIALQDSIPKFSADRHDFIFTVLQTHCSQKSSVSIAIRLHGVTSWSRVLICSVCRYCLLSVPPRAAVELTKHSISSFHEFVVWA
jgi:hypothetical protein